MYTRIYMRVCMLPGGGVSDESLKRYRGTCPHIQRLARNGQAYHNIRDRTAQNFHQNRHSAAPRWVLCYETLPFVFSLFSNYGAKGTMKINSYLPPSYYLLRAFRYFRFEKQREECSRNPELMRLRHAIYICIYQFSMAKDGGINSLYHSFGN